MSLFTFALYVEIQNAYAVSHRVAQCTLSLTEFEQKPYKQLVMPQVLHSSRPAQIPAQAHDDTRRGLVDTKQKQGLHCALFKFLFGYNKECKSYIRARSADGFHVTCFAA